MSKFLGGRDSSLPIARHLREMKAKTQKIAIEAVGKHVYSCSPKRRNSNDWLESPKKPHKIADDYSDASSEESVRIRQIRAKFQAEKVNESNCKWKQMLKDVEKIRA